MLGNPKVHDLFSVKASLLLPEQVSVFGRLEGNLLWRIAAPEKLVAVTVSEIVTPRGRHLKCSTADGFTFAIVDRQTTSLHGCAAVLLVPDASTIDIVADQLKARSGRWILPKTSRPGSADRSATEHQTDLIARSWKDQLTLVEELYEEERLVRTGLRPPQLGAVYATKAHWSVSKLPATVVLPTGSGKTDTMVSLLVSEQIRRLLVIVPSDALRRQIAEKFVKLGVLKTFGCLPADALHPTVAILSKALRTAESIDRLVAESNVIVTTMSAISAMPAELRARLAEKMTHLFVDEAHHIGANTWSEFKRLFAQKLVLQFTATPFRNDGRRVDGRFIYVYPLRQAQRDKLFTSITYVPVSGLDQADTDAQIVEAVGLQLEQDLANGYNHLVMARTNSILRAIELHRLYEARLGQFQPCLIHSDMSAFDRTRALSDLRAGASRIIVCVDMLGEGFDLPDLKIAALHDKHRSESVTLQFVGRFTRARRDLGTATVIANLTLDDVNQSIKALYAEDSDWNHLLSIMGHVRTERERRREDLFAGFSASPETFPMETLEPRFSTVVYRTRCTEWHPEEAALTSDMGSSIIEPPVINAESRLVIFVRKDEEKPRWTTMKSTKNVSYNLVMAHWNPDQELLFINTSKVGDLNLELAKRLAGEDVERIAGEDVFRVLHGFRRLMLMNLGLSETQRKPVRYSQFMGSDIADQLDSLPGNRSRTKTNLFGLGYVDHQEFDEVGNSIGVRPSKETIGVSAKGKLWSYQSSNSFAEWIDWCHVLGSKLINSSITPELILRNVVRPKRITTIPDGKIPIAIAWPERFLHEIEDRILVQIGEAEPSPFFNCEIEIEEFSASHAVKFKVSNGESEARFELRVSGSGVEYEQVAGPVVTIKKGRRETLLLDVFKEDPPHVYFADGDLLVASELFILRRDEDASPYPLDKIQVEDWEGVNIREESQREGKSPTSIQRRVIERLQASTLPYDLIFDDDGAGEIADVVAIRRSGRILTVDLFHCKYSSSDTPGARVEDLYEICGQAQKSVRWAERLDELLLHLRRREADRLRRGAVSRFETGSLGTLTNMIAQWRDVRPQLSITLVQPGYSKAKAARPHLELFAATESYLMDTWRIPMTVLASA